VSGFIQNLLNKIGKADSKPEIPEDKIQTRPLPEEKTLPAREMTITEEIPFDPPQLVAGCSQSVGMQRDHNEDAIYTLTTTLVSDTRHFNFGLYIVADGMGGHKHGEMASGIGVRAMAEHIFQNCYTSLFSQLPSPPEKSLQEIMQDGIQVAHKSIQKQATGGGTTITAVLVLGDQLTIAHVGDSRAYAIKPDGHMQVLTRDHSLVKRLEELGQITAEEAAVHPQRNVLYRALGQGEPFDAEITTLPLPKSGYLLVCSDGLWGVISNDTIFNMISIAPSPAAACQFLVSAANSAGGPDNISAILVRLPE
jgi:serine/threonine protein phosphatase PrpC